MSRVRQSMESYIEEASTREIDPRIFSDNRDPRDPMNYLGIVSLNVPKEYVDSMPGWHFLFVAYSNNGKEFNKNVDDALNRGYTFVLRSEHPSLLKNSSINPFAGQENEMDKYYTMSGHILAKRPIEVHRRELDYINALNKDQDSVRKEHLGNVLEKLSREEQNKIFYI
jgi:hypothetical protein